MFIDEVKVYARAGHGGKGAVAFHREAFVPKGGPSGGNGGRGADVILEASHDLNNLINQFYNPRLMGPNGQAGMGKGMDGLAGKDLIIKVPCGTLVWKLPMDSKVEALPSPKAEAEKEEQRQADADRRRTENDDDELEPNPPFTIANAMGKRPVIRHSGSNRALEIDLTEEGEQQKEERSPGKHKPDGAELVADLTNDGERFVLCKGGRGGLGNRNFATARRQTPRFAQPGEEGAEGNYLLELRIMAEVGLVGYPNAGKSTLLSAISHARPKIAPYPFTTLHPQIGIVEFADYKRLTVCDVPGLIEGAHNNVGLGHAFLRHIERCKVLVLLLDMAGTDGRKPWDDYKQLLSELELYDSALIEKPRLVVANKIDEEAAIENLKKFKRRITKTPVLPISAAFDEGIEKFKAEIRKAVEKSK